MGPAGAGIHRQLQPERSRSHQGVVLTTGGIASNTSPLFNPQLRGRAYVAYHHNELSGIGATPGTATTENPFGVGVGVRYQIVQWRSSSRQYDFTRTDTAADNHREQCKTFPLRCFLTPVNLKPRLPNEESYPRKPQFLRTLLRICAVLDPACWTLISQKSLRSATLRCWPGLCACPPRQ